MRHSAIHRGKLVTMKEPDRDAASNRSLLYLQMVFALVRWDAECAVGPRGTNGSSARPTPRRFRIQNSISLARSIFASITFCAWRWIIPRLRGVLVLRLLVQVMLGIVMFGYGLLRRVSNLAARRERIGSRGSDQFAQHAGDLRD